MNLTDTHTHLYSEQFEEDRDAMIQRAMEAGVDRFFIPAIDSTYTAAMQDLKKNYPDKVFLMTGLHPTHVKENHAEELQHVKEQLTTGNYVAVGEIGVDLYWDQSTRDVQMQAFHQQIEWALEYDLPIAIHCRDAFDEVFAVLATHQDKGLTGIFHCFTGTLEQARLAIKYGMKLGIGGVVTFKNGKIDQFLDQIDIKHVVLETDSPYLSPVPYRGKRNESAYVTQVAEKVAEIYQLDVKEVARITTLNSREVFKV